MKNILGIIVLTLFSFAPLFAQTGGGLSFLKIGFDARNVALGDVGVISATDVAASAYNPALLVADDNSQISFTHNAWMDDVSSELLGAKFNLLGINFGLNINSATISDIEVRETPGEAISTFNAGYFSGGIAAGFDVTDKISIGAGAKYIYESLFSEDANGFGFDFGAYYKNVIDNLNASFAVQNIGSMNELKTESTDLPSSFSLGASYLVPEIGDDFGVTTFAAVKKYFDEDVTHFNLAAEANYKKTIFLRLGYQTGYDARSYSLGLGFMWRNFDIDYAFAPFDYDLGNSHVIGIKYVF